MVIHQVKSQNRKLKVLLLVKSLQRKIKTQEAKLLLSLSVLININNFCQTTYPYWGLFYILFDRYLSFFFCQHIIQSKSSSIVDSGASQHICSNANLFICTKPIKHGTQKTVSISGDIRVSSYLILKDVLFVPQFNCNLLSISALIKASDLIVSVSSLITLSFRI